MRYQILNAKICLDTKTKTVVLIENDGENEFHFKELEACKLVLFETLKDGYEEARCAYEEDKQEAKYE